MSSKLLVQALKPGRRIGRIAEDAVGEAAATARVSDIDLTILQADPRVQLERAIAPAEGVDRLHHIECSQDGPLARHRAGVASDPGAHDRVGVEVGNVDSVPFEGVRNRVEIGIHEDCQLGWRLFLCDRGEAGHVGGETRTIHDPVRLAGVQRLLGQVPDDVLGQVIADGAAHSPLKATLDEILAYQAYQYRGWQLYQNR